MDCQLEASVGRPVRTEIFGEHVSLVEVFTPSFIPFFVILMSSIWHTVSNK